MNKNTADLATIVAKRKKISVEQAYSEIEEIIRDKKPYAAKLALIAYTEDSLHPGHKTLGIEQIDPINHFKE